MCGTFYGFFQYIYLRSDTILFMSLTSLKRFDISLVQENLGQPLAFCIKERGFGFWFCVLEILLCNGVQCCCRECDPRPICWHWISIVWNPSAGRHTYISFRSCCSIIQRFIYVCWWPVLWSCFLTHSHKGQSCLLWGAPELTCSSGGIGGVWSLSICIEGVSHYCCSTFPLALNFAHFMTIFQICSQ